MKRINYGIVTFILLTSVFFPLHSQDEAFSLDDFSKDASIISSQHYRYSSNATVDSLLVYAFKHLHKPYRSGGRGPHAFDCSGFTSFVYAFVGKSLERSSADQVKNGVEVQLNELRPGDLVFYKGRNAKSTRIGHVGIVVSLFPDDTFSFIHAAVSTGVSLDKSSSPYYATRFVSVYRVIADTGPTEQQSVAPTTEAFPSTPAYEQQKVLEPTRQTIRVEKGQSLYAIAKAYGYTVDQLMQWNNLRSTRLEIGQKLIVALSASEIVVVEEEREKNSLSIFHTVKQGETLYAIARNYSCTVGEIKKLNNLNSTRLAIGQVLRVK